MTEPRFDPLGRRWVLQAPERAQRGVPELPPEPSDPEPCDFCPGREDRTPPEIMRIPDADPWRVRVFPNLYPATSVHEVVAHTPDHHLRFEEHDDAHRTDILRAYRARLAAAQTPAIVVVWNRGRAAGASRTHPHGQIFGVDVVPAVLEREAASFAEDPGVMANLVSPGELQVSVRGEVVVAAHPVPLVGHEILVVPPPGPVLPDDDVALSHVAEALSQALRRLRTAIGVDTPFNVVFHVAPRGADGFRWHIHILPRLATWGGLEVGAELPIVAADPLETARLLRDA